MIAHDIENGDGCVAATMVMVIGIAVVAISAMI
jgi:hypothetical protein